MVLVSEVVTSEFMRWPFYFYIITVNPHPSNLVFFLLTLLCLSCKPEQSIDREALVSRHNVINTSFDSLGSLTVGNGGFAYTVDFTGLQTFPEEYARGIPLGTQSDWGWHSFPNVTELRD